MRGMQLSAVVSRARCALGTVSLPVRRSLNIALLQSSTCNCTRPVKDDERRKGLNHMGAEKVWYGQIGCTFRAYRTSDQRRSQHFKSSEHANSDDQAGDSQRGSLAWMACGAGVLAGFAFWQSMQHVLAEAAVVPSLALQEVGGTSSMRMSAGAVEKALGSSDAATLKPALAALILLVDDNDVENTHSTIAKVASKRILGHPDSSVRNAAVCALSALVASDSKAAAASLASLINCGTIPECQRVLADRECAPASLVAAASLLAALSSFEGSWLPPQKSAHRSEGYMEAVSEIARLVTERSLPTGIRLALVTSLGVTVQSTPYAASCVGASAATAEAAVAALALVLLPSSNEDAELQSAALQVLSEASGHASLLPLVASSPTSEHVLLKAASLKTTDALAALQAMKRLVRISAQTAERMSIDCAAPQLIVQAATTHRASKEVREEVAACLEALVANNSDDCRMRVAHFATPIVIALARVSDEDMQVRALQMLRTLCTNGFNKYNMQKSFSVIHELVPFLARSDARQLELVTECLAHLASTDHATFGENARALGEARAMKPLMVLARSKNHLVHRNATWALACMTACERNHVPMRASIDTLLAVARHGSRDAQRYAVMAVSNLAASDRTREMLKEKGAEAILRQCAQSNSGDSMLTSLVNRTALVNLKRNGTQVFLIPPPAGLS